MQPPALARFASSRWILAAALAAVAGGLGVLYYLHRHPTPPAATSDDLPPDPRLSYTGPFQNIAPSVGYVGDAACADCHHDVATSYAQHPMGRSTVLQRDHAAKQRYDEAVRNPFDAKGLRLWVERQGDRVWHHQAQIDAGQPVWSAKHEVSYVVGSGTRGYSYLTELDGYVFQTSISWFSQKDIWDLSPGFPRVQSPGRPVLPGCLFCHANQVKPTPGYSLKYEKGVFDGHAIGCERCHGPGQSHVAYRTSGEIPRDPYDRSIVNPRHLTHQLRDNVCEQCHLGAEARVHRRGQGMFDYRPGMPLEDFLALFVKNPDLPGEHKAVSHVEQMRKSKCYTHTEGKNKLGCVSCHDPHQRVGPQQAAAHYRQRCLNCHQQKGCSVPEAERKKKTADDSCIVCHMPRSQLTDIAHTALTDHEILRPGKDHSSPGKGGALLQLPIVLFHRDHVNENDLERRRDLAIGLVHLLRINRVPALHRERVITEAVTILEEALSKHPTDPAGWQAKGEALVYQNRGDDALAALLKAAEQAPNHEDVLQHLAHLELRRGNTDAALGYWRRVVTVNPVNPDFRHSLAHLMSQKGDWAGVQEQATAGLKLDPGHDKLIAMRVLALLEQGQRDEARKAFELLRKIKPANFGELELWFRRRGG